jgi:hypothetical protein
MKDDFQTFLIAVGAFTFLMSCFTWLMVKVDEDFKRRHPNWRDHEDFIP